MSGVALGLVCAIGFALADFCGGLASKKTNVTVVTAISRCASVPFVGAVTFFLPAATVTLFDVACGVATGVFLLFAFRLLYGVLTRGAMGVNAALTGLMSAVIPLTWAIARGESLTVAGIVGVFVGFASIVVVTWTKQRSSKKDALQSAAAGVLFGLGFVAIGSAHEDSQLVPLLVGQICTAALATAAVAKAKRRTKVDVKTALIASAGGIAASIAAASFVWAVHAGVASVVSVLQATAPVFVAALAWIALRQSLTRRQISGMLMAVLAVVLLAL